MAIFNATPFEGFGLSAVTSGSTFGATHRLPQSSNPDIPAIVVQSSMLSDKHQPAAFHSSVPDVLAGHRGGFWAGNGVFPML